MTDLRHLQLVVLDIARDIDKLCRDAQVEYYLGGGGAIGAIRHKGYIPWDDDLDFLMTYDHYQKFINVCKQRLDQEKYVLELDPAGIPCLKIKLKGTKVVEKGKKNDNPEANNIFLDVFCLDKAPDKEWQQRWQYFFGKLYIAYAMRFEDYIVPSKWKKWLISLAGLLQINFVRKFVLNQINAYNGRSSVNYYACLWGITRFKNTFTAKEVYGKPLYVPFEDTSLPVPEKYDEYLTQFFGNYMQLPPVEKRVAPHIESIDFGKY